MIVLELESKEQLQLIEKALGCIWAEGELSMAEEGRLHKVELAVDYATEQPHVAGEPEWSRGL